LTWTWIADLNLLFLQKNVTLFNRTVDLCVICSAKEKLGYAQDDACQLVVESDGTEVDEEAIAEMQSSTLILLRCSEQWISSEVPCQAPDVALAG